MKTAVAIVAVAVGALYLYNNELSPRAGQAPTQNAQNPPSTSKFLEPGTSAPRSTSIVVAPMPKGGWKIGPNAQTDLAPTINRLKTGPNAQTDLTPTINRWKTGPNAQTDLTPTINRLKTGPNAQTDLTPTINRWKTGPNAQTDLTPTINRWKTGPNAQTDLTLKRSW